MKALVVINPRAGRGDPVAAGRLAVEHLRHAGREVDCIETTHAGHATELAAAHRGDDGLLVAVGGDGTLREALVGWGEPSSSRVLGVVPMGNANVVARELGIPLEPAGAIEVLTAGAARPIDVGVVDDGVEERLFLAMVGVGFDAMVTRGVDGVRHTFWGRWLYSRGFSDAIYGVCALPALLRVRPRRFVIEDDGVPVATAAPTVLVSNTATYAKGWSMTPDARIASGRLHWVAARSADAPHVLLHLRAAARGRAVGSKLATYGDATHLRLVSDAPFRWQVDGDPMPPATSLTLEVRPARAWLLAPR